MKCIKCSKKAGIKLRHLGRLCSKCFLEVIEKRVRKGLRINKLIKKNDQILMIDNRSNEFAVGEYLLKNIIKGLPVKIDVKKTEKSAPKYDKIIIPWSLEDECEAFLETVLNKEKPKKFQKKTVKLLINVSEDEIAEFAKIKKFKYKSKPKSKIRQMLDKLEKQYPGYKFSLLNSIKSIAS